MTRRDARLLPDQLLRRQVETALPGVQHRPDMLRRGGQRGADGVEEHPGLHRQHHLGHLPDRHFGRLRNATGAQRASGQGNDGRGHHPGGQLHRTLDPTLAAGRGQRVQHLRFSRYIHDICPRDDTQDPEIRRRLPSRLCPAIFFPGFILYFAFMSAFFWLNIVAFNVWRAVW